MDGKSTLFLLLLTRKLEPYTASHRHTATTPAHTPNAMKSFSCLAFIASILLPLMVAVPSTAAAAADDDQFSATTCDDLDGWDRDDDETRLHLLSINAAEFMCDNYTTLHVREDMKLTASSGTTAVEFTNFGIMVYENSTLTIEPDVTFSNTTTGVSESFFR